MTYGIPYTVRGWGDEIVTTVMICEPIPEGHTAVIRAGESPVILVPTVALTPVDTTPPEPEPGAWLIGDRVVERIQCDPDEFSPFEPECWRTFANSLEWSWTEFWKEHGGPGVTIRRLVPEPAPVELPWEGRSQTGAFWMRVVQCRRPTDAAAIDAAANVGIDERVATVSAAVAEEMAAALLAAARAAREATP